jgi:hypothetical protein
MAFCACQERETNTYGEDNLMDDLERKIETIQKGISDLPFIDFDGDPFEPIRLVYEKYRDVILDLNTPGWEMWNAIRRYMEGRVRNGGK